MNFTKVLQTNLSGWYHLFEFPKKPYGNRLSPILPEEHICVLNWMEHQFKIQHTRLDIIYSVSLGVMWLYQRDLDLQMLNSFGANLVFNCHLIFMPRNLKIRLDPEIQSGSVLFCGCVYLLTVWSWRSECKEFSKGPNYCHQDWQQSRGEVVKRRDIDVGRLQAFRVWVLI